jgi:hypothetical protein
VFLSFFSSVSVNLLSEVSCMITAVFPNAILDEVLARDLSLLRSTGDLVLTVDSGTITYFHLLRTSGLWSS